MDELRDLIPVLPDFKKPDPFPIDKDLILRDQDPQQFAEFYEEGWRLIKVFNRRITKIVEERECRKQFS